MSHEPVGKIFMRTAVKGFKKEKFQASTLLMISSSRAQLTQIGIEKIRKAVCRPRLSANAPNRRGLRALAIVIMPISIPNACPFFPLRLRKERIIF